MLYHIYCDESRQTQDRYMVIGGIIVSSENGHGSNQGNKLSEQVEKNTPRPQ
ncbi:MAG: hypothetical protein ABH886_10090 [Candidatus Desantisbacteria bacterium]